MMRTIHLRSHALLAAAATLAICLPAAAAAAPVKMVPTGRFGRQVDLAETNAKAGAELEDVCTVASKDECQPGVASEIAGGFDYPEGVAASPNGDIYVADALNHRVQELEPDGKFVLMFGKDVNRTEVEAKAGPTLEDLCTAVSGDVCQAGVVSGGRPMGIAVAPNGDVYVAETVFLKEGESGDRVQELTPEGGFVLEIGKEVNETTKANLCTRQEEVAEKVQCGAPRELSEPFMSQAGSFTFSALTPPLAVGPSGTLYVGDEGRVQEFDEDGTFTGEIPLESPGDFARGLAVDPVTGNVYLNSTEAGKAGTNVVREYGPKNELVRSFEVSSPEAGAGVRILGLAMDGEGHLAVISLLPGEFSTQFGAIYDGADARLISEFGIPVAGQDRFLRAAFDAAGELFVAGGVGEVLSYKSVPIAELTTGASKCTPGPESETDATLDCALEGVVNPEGVAGTQAWFEWGAPGSQLGQSTPKQAVAATGPVSAPVLLRPNAQYEYRLTGEDANVQAPETLRGERVSLTTTAVAPKMIGAPGASFVTAGSAVLRSELNPESASTEYAFEYAPGTGALASCPGVLAGAQCPQVQVAPAGRSSLYGALGAAGEASGLAPNTAYSYRLAAVSENLAKTQKLSALGSEGSFTTAPAPAVSVQTGSYSAVGATSATVSGSVSPGGVPASYHFELGVDEGAGTQYAVVASGPVPASEGPVEETLGLSGLQPGTTYAYRIAATSGYIDNPSHTLQGAQVTFTTAGAPAVIGVQQPLAFLPLPPISFPAESHASHHAPKCAPGHRRARNGRCVAIRRKQKRRRKARKSSHRN